MPSPPGLPAPKVSLEELAWAKFGNLSAGETKLLQAAPKGELAHCGDPAKSDDDPINDPKQSDGWGADREIRAEIIRWLCVNGDASRLVDPRGLRVQSAKVTGELDLSFATVSFPLALFGCRTLEPMDLQSADLHHLDLGGSQTKAVSADGVKVRGDVFLSGGFSAEGEVRLLGADIGGDLDCSKGTFKKPGGNALSADSAKVRGSVFLRGGFSADGVVRLHSATAGVLADDVAAWPSQGNLLITGFTYRGIAGPTDAKSRLDWLRRQLPKSKKDRRNAFHPQPYEQLASVLREQGMDSQARAILIGMEDDRRRYARLSRTSWIWAWVTKCTIAYGHRPSRAFWWLLALWLFGFLAFGSGYQARVMGPTDKDSNAEFIKRGQTLAYHQPFCAAAYSLDLALPIIDLGQKTAWGPAVPLDSVGTLYPDPTSWTARAFCEVVWTRTAVARISFSVSQLTMSAIVIRYRWIHMLLGWFLTTMLVAGVTGLVGRQR